MVLGILTVQSVLCGAAMKKPVTPEQMDIARFTEPELTLASQSLNGPDKAAQAKWKGKPCFSIPQHPFCTTTALLSFLRAGIHCIHRAPPG